MGPFSEDSLLVSWDVVALFPNIDNNLGINAVIEALEARPARFPSADCIVEAVQICLSIIIRFLKPTTFFRFMVQPWAPRMLAVMLILPWELLIGEPDQGKLNPICGGDTGMIFLISGHKGQSNSTSLRNLSTLYTPPLNSLWFHRPPHLMY